MVPSSNRVQASPLHDDAMAAHTTVNTTRSARRTQANVGLTSRFLICFLHFCLQHMHISDASCFQSMPRLGGDPLSSLLLDDQITGKVKKATLFSGPTAGFLCPIVDDPKQEGVSFIQCWPSHRLYRPFQTSSDERDSSSSSLCPWIPLRCALPALSGNTCHILAQDNCSLHQGGVSHGHILILLMRWCVMIRRSGAFKRWHGTHNAARLHPRALHAGALLHCPCLLLYCAITRV